MEAKKGFGFIVMLGQLGGIIIPTSLSYIRSFLQLPQTILIVCSSLMLLVGIWVMWLLTNTVSERNMQGYEGNASEQVIHRKELGLFEGLRLIGMYKYLTGIALLILCFEYVVTLLDFNFKTMVFASSSDAIGASAILSQYALSINIITFALLALGINNIQRVYGIRWSFIVTFICMGSALFVLYFIPTIPLVMATLIIAKAVNYALNNPSIKQLYIPTSTDVKYQSQTWIETFGLGGAKVLSSLTGLSKYALGNILFLSLSSSGSFVILCVWVIIALAISARWNKAIDKNEIIC